MRLTTATPNSSDPGLEFPHLALGFLTEQLIFFHSLVISKIFNYFVEGPTVLSHGRLDVSHNPCLCSRSGGGVRAEVDWTAGCQLAHRIHQFLDEASVQFHLRRPVTIPVPDVGNRPPQTLTFLITLEGKNLYPDTVEDPDRTSFTQGAGRGINRPDSQGSGAAVIQVSQLGQTETEGVPGRSTIKPVQ